MTIPLWLPWVVLLALLAAALPRPESSLRTWGPAVIALLVAIWITVDHYWVTQSELADATRDAAAAVDGSMGGVTQGRLRIEIQDRLGSTVVMQTAPPDADGDSADITYGFTVSASADASDEPAMCVRVVESRVDTTVSAITVASVDTDPGPCQ